MTPSTASALGRSSLPARNARNVGPGADDRATIVSSGFGNIMESCMTRGTLPVIVGPRFPEPHDVPPEVADRAAGRVGTEPVRRLFRAASRAEGCHDRDRE